jgi:hypothetical protein
MGNRAQRFAGLASILTITLAGLAPAAWGQGPPGAPDPKIIAAAEAKPTPMKGKHADLTGKWMQPRGGGPPAGIAAPVLGPPGAPGKTESNVIRVFPAEVEETQNQRDFKATAARRANTALRPVYAKPADAAKAMKNFDEGSQNDPTYSCKLPGVARLGMPAEIYQSDNSVALLYTGLSQAYRVVPLDGRKYNLADLDPVPLGYPSGRWEGDTLVIETIGFPDDQWLNGDGSFHSDKLKMTERITRKGDVLHYVIVAEDPLFAKPFTVADRRLLLDKPGEIIDSPYQCNEIAQEYLVNGAKH